jgi:hypothetical protein
MFMAAIAIAFRWSWIVVFETLSAASTLTLVVGAIIEYKPKLAQIAFLLKKLLLGRITPFERCALGAISRHTIGPMLVVLGIGGELVFGLGAFIAQEVESTQDESRIAQLQNDNLRLQNRIVDIFGPRNLTPEQSARIAEKLAGLKGAKIDVFVPALASPYDPTEVADSLKTGISVVRTLRAAHMDVGGWLVQSCQPLGASNLVFGVASDEPIAKQSLDRQTALQALKAFAPEVGTYPEVEQSYFRVLACTTFSDLDGIGPNTRMHDAAINITIGIKINPLLTREMLEPK